VSPGNAIHKIVALSNDAGSRIDTFASLKIADLTRSRIKHLIEDGFVTVNGKVVKASYLISNGDEVVIEVPAPVEPSARPEDIPLDVIFEDSDIIVVNKSAGMVVHPAAGHPGGTLVNALLAHCDDLSGIGGELKAGIVHRLDIGTSGVIIAAKNDIAHHSLAAQFKARTVKKIYGALVYGSMRSESGVIDQAIGRSTGHRKRFSAQTRKGREALTEWRVLERFASQLSWLEITLRTGRTHQIRVHFTEIGHPLVGDPLYGGQRKLKRVADESIREVIENFNRPALHACRLGIDHPRTKDRMEFEAEIPEDLAVLLGELRIVCEPVNQ